MNFKSNVMNLNFSGDVGYFTFKGLEKYDFLSHAYSTRLGGVSKNEFKSMNLSFACGDEYENVVRNYEIFCKALDFDLNKVVRAKQVHGNKIKMVYENYIKRGDFKKEGSEEADGFITNVPGIVLSTRHADCPSIFMVDPVLKVVGLVHAGWRGTASKIAKSLLDAFVDKYGSNPENIVCALGLGIGKCCFEVREDAFEEFKKMELAAFDACYEKKEDSYSIDLLEVNKQLLMELDVPEANIHKSDVCTCCNHELLFSHRASGGKRGNNAAFIVIRN